jgi:hypothetical protein
MGGARPTGGGGHRRPQHLDLRTGELQHFTEINTFLKALSVENVRATGKHDPAIFGVYHAPEGIRAFTYAEIRELPALARRQGWNEQPSGECFLTLRLRNSRVNGAAGHGLAARDIAGCAWPAIREGRVVRKSVPKSGTLLL